MKNAIIMALPPGETSYLWAKTLPYLKESIDVKFFIYGEKESFIRAKDAFLSAYNNSIILSKKRLIKGTHLPKASQRNYLDQSDLEAISKFETYATNMMNRFDPISNNFNSEYRTFFFRSYVTMWLDVIDDYKIDIVISADMPHRVFDFALFTACHLRKISFKNLARIYFLNDSYGIAKHPLSYEILQYKVRNSTLSDIDNLTSKIRSSSYIAAMPEYMKKHKKSLINGNTLKYLSTIKKALKKNIIGKNREVFSFYTKKGKLPQDSIFTKYQYIATEIYCQYILIKNKSKIEQAIQKRRFDSQLDSDYVLFALHHQPEATTNPLGGYYYDQILAIEAMDKLLPQNIYIVIKENYTQYQNTGFDSPSAGRSNLFYDRIKNLSNRVYFCGMFDDIFKLIDNSIATATITGSIGYESILRGKPTLFFGNPWYKSLEGAFHVDTKEKLKSAIKTVLEKKPNINQKHNQEKLLSIYNSATRIENTLDLKKLITIMVNIRND